MSHELTEAMIDHWSNSSMGMLLRNPLAFKKKYIFKIYESTKNVSGVIGEAGHKAVEVFLRAKQEGQSITVDEAIESGMEVINTYGDIAIDYGKTGSREKMIKEYTQAINHYFDEMPDWDNREILFVEGKMVHTIHNEEGKEMPLPAKCFVDVIWRSTREETFAEKKYPKGTLFIEDHKFTRSYTSTDEMTDPEKLRQAFFNFLISREELREEAAAILYNEIKISKNKNGDAQSQYYTIDFNEVRQELEAFFQLYIDCTKFVMNPDSIYLPNTGDLYDGKDAWLAYRNNLITADAPKVIHKTTAETQVVEKSYHESAPDKVENKHIPTEEKIRLKLQEFGIPVKMEKTYKNGSVVMYTLKPSRGVRMSTISKHEKDIAIAIEAKTIRVQAPIMGTDTVGIEVPNQNREQVDFFIDGAPNPILQLEQGTLNIPVGMNVYGEVVTKNLEEMPHLLIAGSTGSGKSVMLNTIIHSLKEQNSPEELKMALIDPKRVELKSFENLPHLMTGIIKDSERALRALKWMVEEMESRYSIFEKNGYRNLKEYNLNESNQIPKIVVIIDEFASLMDTARDGFTEFKICEDHERFAIDRYWNPYKLLHTKTKRRKKEQQWVEDVLDCTDCQKIEYPPLERLIVRLAQEARAAGIHLIIATQRPSVDVVTGLIKNNLPTRISFRVPQAVDSKTILDTQGAEMLNGKGDMLYLDPSGSDLQRLQGFYA